MASVAGLANTLREIHEFLAALTATPEMSLSEDEAKRLATALAEVQKHYPIPALSPGKVALATLIWTAGALYKPRIGAMLIRKRGGVPPRRGEVVSLRAVPDTAAASEPADDWLAPQGPPV